MSKIPNWRLLTLAVLAALLVTGCNQPASELPEIPVVTFDTATQRPFVARGIREYPALHPDTGRPTLMPAMYCPKCAEWRLTPPLEELTRSQQPPRCSKCKNTLSLEGPVPQN